MYRQLASIYLEEGLPLFAVAALSQVVWLDPAAQDVKKRIDSIRQSIGIRAPNKLA